MFTWWDLSSYHQHQNITQPMKSIIKLLYEYGPLKLNGLIIQILFSLRFGILSCFSWIYSKLNTLVKFCFPPRNGRSNVWNWLQRGDYKEMSSTFADQERPRIWAPMRGEGRGELRGSQPMSTAVQCTPGRRYSWRGLRAEHGTISGWCSVVYKWKF